MTPHALAKSATVLSLLAPTWALAAPAECRDAAPYQRLPETVRGLGTPLRLALLGTSILPPVLFAPSGFDHRLRVVAQRDLGGRHNLEPASLAAPYVLAGGVLIGYGLAAASSACAWQRPQAAMLQAMALSVGTVAVLKWSVGRQWPSGGADPRAPDRLEHPERAHDFRPLRRGFAAWPSGHAAVTFSAAAALARSVPEWGWLRWVGYPFAAAVSFGMWIGDHHWASDILSGALIGEAVGSSAGASFSPALPAGSLWILPAAPDGVILGWASPL